MGHCRQHTKGACQFNKVDKVREVTSNVGFWIDALWERQAKCQTPSVPLSWGEAPDKHMAHSIMLSLGGPSNVQCAIQRGAPLRTGCLYLYFIPANRRSPPLLLYLVSCLLMSVRFRFLFILSVCTNIHKFVTVEQ